LKILKKLNLLFKGYPSKFSDFKMKKLLVIFLLNTLIVFACGKQDFYRATADHDKLQIIRAHDYYTTGMFYQIRGQHESALIEFYQALLYDSTSSEIYNRIAENHMALGRYESALRYLQKSQIYNPEEVETFRLIADCYYRLNNEDQSIEYLNKVLQIDPLDQNARSLLLLLYRKTNDQLGLARQYEQLIELYGEDQEWIQRAAEIYIKEGKLDNALILYKSSVVADSTNAGLWFSLGTIYEMMKKKDDAVLSYLKALHYAPEKSPAAEGLFRIYRENGDWDKIIEVFKPFHAAYDSISFYNIYIAEAYLFSKRLNEAKELLTPLLNNENIPWRTYELLGRIELEQDHYPEASQYFQNIIELDTKNRVGWLYQGIVLAETDSANVLEQHYRRALEYLPNDPLLLSFHGISLSRIGRQEEALVPLEKALKIDPYNLNALISYGLALNQLDRNREALIPLNKGLTIDSTNITILSTLGMIYDDLKMYNTCDSLYEIALKIHPDSDLLLNNYAYSLAERSERLEFALEMAEKAIQSQPKNGAYLDTIGWIHYKLGNYDLAFKYVKQSLDNRENSPVVVEHLGDILLKLGDKEQAINYWKRAIELNGNKEKLRQKIENN